MCTCKDCIKRKVCFTTISEPTPDMKQLNEDMFVKCLDGHNEVIFNFFKEYGNMTSKQIDELNIKYNCYQQSELSDKLDEILYLMNDFLNDIKNK